MKKRIAPNIPSVSIVAAINTHPKVTSSRKKNAIKEIKTVLILESV